MPWLCVLSRSGGGGVGTLWRWIALINKLGAVAARALKVFVKFVNKDLTGSQSPEEWPLHLWTRKGASERDRDTDRERDREREREYNNNIYGAPSRKNPSAYKDKYTLITHTHTHTRTHTRRRTRPPPPPHTHTHTLQIHALQVMG